MPQINLSLLMVIVFLMPIHLRFIPVLIALFTVSNIADGILNKTFSLKEKSIFITGILFFLIHFISIFYSEDKDAARFDIGVKFSFLLFPLIFLFKNPFVIERKKWVLTSFVVGSLVSAIAMLIIAFVRFDGQNSFVFYYIELGLFHPSYMAMYFIFAILILIDLIEKDLLKVKQRIWGYFAILFLLILISFLQSKAGILSIIMISIYYLIFSFIRSRPLILRSAFLILAVSVSLIFAQQNNRFQAMAESVETISEEGQSDSSTGVRYSMWKIAVSAIEEHWLIGVGAGDIKPILFEKYKEAQLNDAIERNYNVHNQYLETFLGQGLAGISLLLLLLFLGIKEALKRKELLLSGFILLIALSMGPESMLNSQMGVVFIAFFYYFLYSYEMPVKEESI